MKRQINSDTPELAEEHKEFARKSVVSDYCGSGYKQYTRTLLQEHGQTPAHRPNFEKIPEKDKQNALCAAYEMQDCILQAPRLQTSITLIRGQRGTDYLKGHNSYTFWNFISATSQWDIARGFGPVVANGRGFYIEFECPPEFPMLHTGACDYRIHHPEYEYIFPMGTTVKVIRVYEKTDTDRWTLGTFKVPVYVCVPTFLDKYSRAKRKRIKR